MEEINIREWHTLLYSHSQNAFHASTVGATLNDELNSFRKYRPPSDWILVGVFEDEKELHKFGKLLTEERSGTRPFPPALPHLG